MFKVIKIWKDDKVQDIRYIVVVIVIISIIIIKNL